MLRKGLNPKYSGICKTMVILRNLSDLYLNLWFGILIFLGLEIKRHWWHIISIIKSIVCYQWSPRYFDYKAPDYLLCRLGQRLINTHGCSIEVVRGNCGLQEAWSPGSGRLQRQQDGVHRSGHWVYWSNDGIYRSLRQNQNIVQIKIKWIILL